MRTLRQGVFVTGAVILAAAFALEAPATQAPPFTRRDNVSEILHGVEIVDPYRWLETQQSPETRAWIEAQNEYTDAVLGSLPGRAKLRQDLEALMRIDDIDRPTHRGGRYFFSQRSADQDLDVIYMRQGHTGVDVILVDPHPLSHDHTVSTSLMGVSPDGNLIAYGLRKGGEDEVALRILDVQSRQDLPDTFTKGRYYDIRITNDASGFYYGRYDSVGERIYYHAIGSDPERDPLIFGEGYSPEMGISVDLSEDGRYLLFTVYEGSAALKTEVYFQDLSANGEIRTIVNDIDAKFEGRIGGSTLFLHTTWEAPNGRIIAVELENPAKGNWSEIIPETGAVIDDFILAGHRLMVKYLYNVIPTVKVFEPDGVYLTAINPPAIGWLGAMAGRWQDDEAFFSYSTYHIPTKIYLYNTGTLTSTTWAEVEIPVEAGYFAVRQVWYASADGTRIPMFIAHRTGLELDGSNPALLTGYGGFNSSMLPYYSAWAALWIDAGGVYAVPNLRGGGEFGDDWHRAGMLENKQNTFDDFIAAAEWLIANRYTSPEKLAITGGSNGGLLVGAALTQRPDLFKAVVCTYPLLDMVRYHRFLVAQWWVPEYGSSEDPVQFEYLRQYSPYHNVVEGRAYPAVLFVTGDSDTRVDPLHARKMTALLQSATGSQAPILLDYDTAAGHAGGRPLSRRIEDSTDHLLFLFWQLGIDF